MNFFSGLFISFLEEGVQKLGCIGVKKVVFQVVPLALAGEKVIRLGFEQTLEGTIVEWTEPPV
ncbi:Hypothetical protein Minf_1604 [Methylacidiphilum infernorum V4]|uniref:Uncharacterized protein n=2 Tax=Candidatus Methylacidiphilum infernorum TaxID=511746 RepID=B3DWF5_METI4|nr:Hypothetical protein Minf_1604 [Methylacidiphilum infernorum V4]